MHQKERFLLKFLLIHCNYSFSFVAHSFILSLTGFFFYWLPPKSRICAKIAPPYLENTLTSLSQLFFIESDAI